MDFKRITQRVIRAVNDGRIPGAAAKTENASEKLPATVVDNPFAPSNTLVFLAWFRKQLKQLCEATALHGYSQIVRDGYNSVERGLWIFAVSSSFVTSVVLLWISWTWNSETPTLTVIESTNYATWNLPFPAVTICNLNKMSASAALLRAQKMIRPNNMSAEELASKFRLLLHANGLADGYKTDYQELHDILLLNNLEIPQLMGEFTQPCRTMLDRCMWKGTQAGCEDMFQTVNSTEGLCCSFNYYGTRINHNQKKTSASAPNDPRRVTASGFQTGLSLILNPDIDDYHTTTIATTGFKILIHGPFDFPDENAQSKIVSSKTESYISILPRETYITEDAFSLDPVVRNCYAHNEIRMDTMQRYSYVNCKVECRARQIYKACKCIPYHMPSNGTLPNCELIDMSCLAEHVVLYRSAVPAMNLSVIQVGQKVPRPCDCLPSCAMVQYPVEMRYGRLNRTFTYNSLSFYKDINLTDHSVVHIYFNDLTATRFRKDIYQNWLGTLASFGGLLGLFLGFSIITGFEVIYFFTIRVLFDVFAKPSNQQRGRLNIDRE